MELQEKVTALEAQVKQYASMVENLNAEKIALDQMLVESLKSGLDSKKNVLMRDKTINDLKNQIQILMKENEALHAIQADKDRLQNVVELMAAEAQG